MQEPTGSVVVVGTGYVGLPVALLLARAGYDVVGVDNDKRIVRAINDGILRLDETELQSVMDDPAVRSNLRAATEPQPADVFIIAVPTPLDSPTRTADLSHVEAAARSIARVLRRGNLVIVESTVPPLTCRNVLTPILEESGLQRNIDFHVAHCPERVLPGNILQEIVDNPRIVGSETQDGAALASALYASFVQGDLHLTDDVTAELVKLMENAYRDVNIALANEFSAVASGLDIDILEGVTLANMHPRVNILRPGIGVGGHCIPIDPWFINEIDPINSRLIQTARQVNDAQPAKVADEIRRSIAGLEDPKVVLVGAAYKPNVADARESPALKVAELLRAEGYDVVTYDPLFAEYRVAATLEEAATRADCLAILVPHDIVVAEMGRNRSSIETAMNEPRVLIFDRGAATRAGSGIRL